MAQVIYGSEVSKDIRAELSEQIGALRAAGRRMPTALCRRSPTDMRPTWGRAA